jgi:hydroxymethylpyrimidine pyrophosphatase-like HAD family hydrolase
MTLFVSDLDGTLFSDFAGFEEAPRLQLRRLIETHEAPFTIATARVLPSSMQALGHPPIKLPMIACGGAVLQKPSGEIIFERLLSGRIAVEAVKLFKSKGFGMTLILSPRQDSQRRYWVPEGFRLMEPFIASHWKDASFLPMRDGDDVASLPLVGLSCCAEKGALDPVVDWAKQFPDLRFELVDDPYQAGVQVGFLQDDRANKGETLAILCEHLGSDASEATVFGDGHNDLSLFAPERPWHKVAAKVAVPEIKALADTVLSGDDSVLNYIERTWRR